MKQRDTHDPWKPQSNSDSRNPRLGECRVLTPTFSSGVGNLLLQWGREREFGNICQLH